MAVVRHKESIHSGQFMVSNFEAEDEDEGEDLDPSVRYPSRTTGEGFIDATVNDVTAEEPGPAQFTSVVSLLNNSDVCQADKLIDNNLTKLFQCMSIVYRQKLTSPKWNRFLGLKLRWKDKIRLNNVIWRCWHMQFVKRQRKLVFTFANPLEIDYYNKTAAGAIMMGKYWKRKMDSVLAEYKKWRVFYKNQNTGAECVKHSKADKTLIKTGQDDIDLESMITDADFFVDAIFNSLESQPGDFDDDGNTCFTNSDFIQPGLIQLQPNLDDLLDFDPMVAMSDWFPLKPPDPCTNCTIPVRRKSLTPDQDVFNQKYTLNHGKPRQMAPVTDVEMVHSTHVNTAMKNNLGRNSLAAMNFKSIPEMQAINPKLCYEAKPASAVSAISSRCSSQPTLPDTGQWRQQNSVITNNLGHGSKMIHYKDGVINKNEANKNHLAQNPLYQEHFVLPVKVGLGIKSTRRVLDQDSELARLLQRENSDPRLTNTSAKYVQKPMKKQTRQSDKSITEGVQFDPPGFFKPMIMIPPPPPGSLPQPSFTSGSSTSVNAVEDKKTTFAERKRKGTIKNGFDMLRTLVPSLANLPTVKISKAGQLGKAAEYLLQLEEDNEAIRREVETLRRSVEIVQEDIRCSQKQLPSGGSAVSTEQSLLQEMFCRHVESCTRQNWKYWVFSRIMEPVLESFDRAVSSSSRDDLARTSSSWLDQHVTLVQLRPLVTNAVKDLSVDTAILTEPHKMPIEALNSAASLAYYSSER